MEISRNGSGVYSLPAGTAAVTSETISSTKFNTLTEDLEADANEVRPIVAGGTGAASASAARTSLGFAPIEPLLTDPGADRITFWDDSESAFGYLTLGAGLSITTTVLSLDADLSTLAGLTVAADNFIAGNAGGTAWEVKTPAQARTSLGLANLATTTGSAFALTLLDDADAATALTTLGALPAASYTAADVLTKIKTVDGAGSGLDADTVDGVEASALAALASSNVFSGATQTISAASPVLILRDSDAAGASAATGVLRYQDSTTATVGEVIFFNGAMFITASDATVGSITFRTGGNNVRLTLSADGDATFSGAVAADTINAPPAVGSVTSGTLTRAGNANQQVTLTGNITMPNAVFEAGDIGICGAAGSARTVTRGASVFMFVNGANVASATIAARGTMGFRWEASNTLYLSGDVS